MFIENGCFELTFKTDEKLYSELIKLTNLLFFELKDGTVVFKIYIQFDRSYITSLIKSGLKESYDIQDWSVT